jgi:hypothetical protein
MDVKTQNTHELGQNQQIRVGDEPGPAKRSLPEPAHGRHIKGFKHWIHADPVPVSDAVLEAHGSSVDQDEIHRSRWYTERLDGVHYGLFPRKRDLQGFLPLSRGKEIIQFFVESKKGLGHGFSSVK